MNVKENKARLTPFMTANDIENKNINGLGAYIHIDLCVYVIITLPVTIP